MKSSVIKVEQIERIYCFCRRYVKLNIMASFVMIAMLFTGAMVLICRYLEVPEVYLYSVGSAILLISIVMAWWRASRITFTIDDVAGWLDRQCKAGGLLMTLLERNDLSGWEEAVERLAIPEVKGQWRRCFISVIGALLFVLICCWVPLPEIEKINPPQKLDISDQVDSLQDKLNALKELGAVEEDRQEQLSKLLKDLEKNTDALQPGKVYESLDAVESALKDLGDNAAGNMMSGSTLMQQLESMSEQLETGKDPEMEKRMRQLAKNLSEMLKQNPELANCCNVKGGLKTDQLLSSVLNRPPPMDEQMMKKLVESLKKSRDQLNDACKKLQQAGVTSRQLQALKKFLEQNKQLCATSGRGGEMWLNNQQIEALKKQFGGTGGISRGRGDAPMFFGQEAPKLADPLSQAKMNSDKLDMKLGEAMGLSFAAPEVKPVDDDIHGTMSTGVGTGGQARVIRISPKDKKLVKRYFDKSSGKSD
jgi:hypothetical protein